MTEDSLHWHALNYRTASTQHAHEMFVALEDYVRCSSQRTWVGLTDEERNDCLVDADPCECLATPEAEELMRCIEAKLKEKNT